MFSNIETNINKFWSMYAASRRVIHKEFSFLLMCLVKFPFYLCNIFSFNQIKHLEAILRDFYIEL
jgi:hypothetical protein